jgi:succinate dehydrogenase hydrophobic anchor subunit
MLRAFLEIAGVFLLPFLLFGIYRLFRNDAKEEADAARFKPYAWLTLAGLLLVVGFIVYSMVNTTRGQGAYHPAKVEKGVLVPGKID